MKKNQNYQFSELNTIPTFKQSIRPYIVNIIAVLAIYFLFQSLFDDGTINRYYQGIIIMVGINIILATSLNLTIGFLGQLTLGHAGFMSVGAYSSALCSLYLKSSDAFVSIPVDLQFPIALAFGGLIAAIFGLLIGIPALRLRGDYLAIITLGFGEIIRTVILNLEFTGGARGLKGIPFRSDFLYVFVVMVITIYVLWTLIHSRHGRAIKSIREDEIAAEAAGVKTIYYKLQAFVVAALFAGIAGGLFAHKPIILDATKYDFNRSIEIVVMVVLGGMGSITGSIVAAIVLTILPELLRDFAEYRMVIYAAILIAFMIFKPSGLFGHYEFSPNKVINYIVRKVKK